MTSHGAATRAAYGSVRLTLLLGLASGCEPTARPWVTHPDAASDGDASGDATDGGPDDAATPRVSFRWAREEGAAASGCDREGEVERLAAAWSLLARHALAPSPDFAACLERQVYSPSAFGFAEEILARITAAVSRVACEDLRAGSGGHGHVRATDTTLSFGHDLLATRSPARVAGAALHAMLHAQTYLHHSGDDGEYPYSVPEQVDRCLQLAAGEGGAATSPPLQTRDRMVIESELQPIGYLRASRAPPYLLECPPGSWVVGAGASLNITSPARVASFGLRCRDDRGAEARRTVGDVATWDACPDGSVAVGVSARASFFYVHAATLLCDRWEDVRAGARGEQRPLTLPGHTEGHAVTRRCPPGQVLRAVSGIAAATTIHQLTAVCRDPARPRIGDHVDLPMVGATSRYPGDRVRRRSRCGDQGVIVGLFGHRSQTGNLIRLGALCRGTEHAGGALGFRRVTSGGTTALVPEHALVGTGGNPAFETPEAPTFQSLPGVDNRGRCPDGMGFVGLRVRRDDLAGTPHHIQGLCAPLDAWLTPRPPPPTRVNIVGAWDTDTPLGTELRQCPAGSFLTGMEVEQPEIDPALGVVDMVERVTPICRSFVIAP